MIKPKGDKQVEYLDLDLDSGKSTPPRKVSETSFYKYTELPYETWRIGSPLGEFS